ncbi:MAG TPA: DUF488 domain-containing protein [Solirubrobacterales bacterium]|nr:DUF488 domain-containing protein [Solirubrobacterales bacterium]
MQSSDQPGDAFGIATIGHSTHSLDRFLELLASHGIEALADVRRFPGSRRMPHFSEESLAAELPRHGIAYLSFKELGGRRPARPDSANTGWRVAGFRGYADFMGTAEFAAGLARLEAEADARRTAIMCAEGLWWRCHRRLISDALVARGRPVTHIAPDGRTTPHELTDFAVVEDGRLTYPAPQGELDV